VCRTQIEAAAAEAAREIEDDHYGVNLQVVPDGTAESEVAAALARTHQRRPDLDDPAPLLSGSWAEARTQIGQFVEAGLSKFVVRPAVPVTSRSDFLDRFVEELLPLQN
jgi:alkanesulfonate monooxygenase SsuD/methylene tetrahydromethanopterin reductase-like flavin-dependent oxidoreductase (luciferase family)